MITRKNFLKTSILAIPAIAIAQSPTAQAVPLIGGYGLTNNASMLANYIMNNYPGVQSIGGVRPDRLPDHPSGHAIDIMIGSNMGLGDTIRADIQSQSQRFGVKYILWRVPNHFNHVHVTVY
jgi:hypothetical protein